MCQNVNWVPTYPRQKKKKWVTQWVVSVISRTARVISPFPAAECAVILACHSQCIPNDNKATFQMRKHIKTETMITLKT